VFGILPAATGQILVMIWITTLGLGLELPWWSFVLSEYSCCRVI